MRSWLYLSIILMILLTSCGSSNTNTIPTTLSSSARFDHGTWAEWNLAEQIKILTGDFNNDGMTDVMKFDVAASGNYQTLGLWVGLSDGTKFNTTKWAEWDTSKDIKVLAGDFNNDGITDVIQFNIPPFTWSEGPYYGDYYEDDRIYETRELVVGLAIFSP